jgi:single-strand DNA-binding protein
MDLNKAMIIGRLTNDPEVRTAPSGQSVTSFGVATNLIWNDAQGQRQEKVEYHNVVCWRKLAEICGQYLQKGRRVYIEGRLQTRQWEGQDGVKRNRTEIIADNMIMLDRGDSSAGSPPPSQSEEPPVIEVSEGQPQSDERATPKPEEGEQSKEKVNIEDIPF